MTQYTFLPRDVAPGGDRGPESTEQEPRAALALGDLCGSVADDVEKGVLLGVCHERRPGLWAELDGHERDGATTVVDEQLGGEDKAFAIGPTPHAFASRALCASGPPA
jgi:hypothetical protein